MYNTFLSYNSADRPLVASIAVALRDAAGIEVFYDEWSLVPGDAWQEELEKSLWASASCAIFIGANGFGPWHKEEMRSALERRVGDQTFRVIPVLLPSSSVAAAPAVPLFLRRYSWVDFRQGLDDRKEFERLVRGILGQKSRASQIADQVRHRLEDANSDALNMVQEHWKVDEVASHGKSLTYSYMGAVLIFCVFALSGWPTPGRTLLWLMGCAFFLALPFWYLLSERRFQRTREKYAQKFNNLYGGWRFRINPWQIFKLEIMHCPDCNTKSICSRLNGRSAYIVRNTLWHSTLILGSFGAMLLSVEYTNSQGWALLLFMGTLLTVRELWGWRRIKFLCLVRGHEFSSLDGTLPQLAAKLLRSFSQG